MFSSLFFFFFFPASVVDKMIYNYGTTPSHQVPHHQTPAAMGKGGDDGWGLILVLVVVLWLAAVGYFSVALAKGGEDKFADWDAVPCYIT